MLPDEVRSMPPQVLFPMLLDQLVDRKALVIAARKQGWRYDPQVKAGGRPGHRHGAAERAAEAARSPPNVTEAALRARYQQDIAGKPGEERCMRATSWSPPRPRPSRSSPS